MQSLDTLIRTKLHLPLTRPGLVARPRLQARIAEGLRGPLTLITAPAGFGKTTLVAACVAGCGMPVAWLSLDRDDNQAGRFLRYLVAAVREADPAIGSEAAQLASQQASLAEQALVEPLSERELEILHLADAPFLVARYIEAVMIQARRPTTNRATNTRIQVSA